MKEVRRALGRVVAGYMDDEVVLHCGLVDERNEAIG